MSDGVTYEAALRVVRLLADALERYAEGDDLSLETLGEGLEHCGAGLRQMEPREIHPLDRQRWIIADHNLDTGALNDGWKILWLNIGGRDHDACSNTVQFDQAQGGEELVRGTQNNIAAGQIGVERPAHIGQPDRLKAPKQGSCAAGDGGTQSFSPRRHLGRI